jgi:D-serine deaminase-like pyridoxal phosphate-dependent protein
MTLDELSTPALILDRGKLQANLDRMAAAVARHRVPLRPHLKTAKSAAVARLAFGGGTGPITVSTLTEAEYFADHGFDDITLAAALTPAKLDRAGTLARRIRVLTLVTDDVGVAEAIARHVAPFRALVEIDSGERRSGVLADSPALLEVARALGPKLSGVLTHGGHSYLMRDLPSMRRVAEEERSAVVAAATRLRAAGLNSPVVSVGSTPTALHAERLEGVTEVRAGVYMFGDLFQAELGSNTHDQMALTVLSSVIGRRPEEGRVVLDAGALALSKDRSTEKTSHDAGFGLVWDIDGRPSFGRAVIERAYQEHGVVTSDRPASFNELAIGSKVRVAPNHACITAAAYERYFVVDGGREVVAEFDRINGWE